MKKYELLKDDKIELNGITLYHIRALRDFSDVKAGDLGGYIEKESNLSHEGDCWVYNDAKVFDNAKVYGSAKVKTKAKVYGNARVHGSAMVIGEARVFEYAHLYERARVSHIASVHGNAMILGNAKVSIDVNIYGDARLSGNALVSEQKDVVWFSNINSNFETLTISNGKDEGLLVTRGGVTCTVDDFLDSSAKFNNGRTHREIELLIEVAKSRILNG